MTPLAEQDIPEPKLCQVYLILQCRKWTCFKRKPEAVAIKVILAPDSLSVTLKSKEAIADYCNTTKSELPVAVKDTYVGLGFGAEGLTFEIKTGVEGIKLTHQDRRCTNQRNG